MKKERSLLLEINKISISKLNNITGSGGNTSNSLNNQCDNETKETIPGVNCKTGDTKTNRSLVTCVAPSEKC